MVEISKRGIKILNHLINKTSPETIERISKEFKVSIRTVQSDLDSIDFFLKGNNLILLDRKRKYGISLNQNPIQREEVSNALSNLEIDEYALNRIERKELVLKVLFTKRSYITIKEICEIVHFSKGTVINCLNKLKDELILENIRIVSHPRYGVKIQGEENNLRIILINRFVNNADVCIAYDFERYYREGIGNRFYKIIDQDIISQFISQVSLIEKEIDTNFSEKSFIQILTAIELSFLRIKIGKFVALNKVQLECLFGTKEFNAILKVAENFKNRKIIDLPLDEIGFITTQLLGCSSTGMNDSIGRENFAEIQLIVCDLINKIGSDLGIDFTKNITLYNDLIYHIRPAIYRMRNCIKQDNPLISDIKRNYPTIYYSVEENIAKLEEFTEATLSEDEIGFITIHFASAMLKEKASIYHRPKVLIVCNSGIGTSNILASKLSNLYEVKIVNVIALHEMEKSLEKNETDYVISTIELLNCSSPVINVSPLITDQDMELLDKFFNRKFEESINVDKLISIIEKCSLEFDKSRLIEELSKEFTLIKNTDRERLNFVMLKDVINKEMIELDFNADDWELAVKEAGNLLFLNHCVEERYITSMVDAVKSIGPYIVIGKGIALPHSRSSDGVLKIGISILRLKNPVIFGHPENDPVDLVFALSAIDNSSHLRVLSDLAKMLNSEDNVKKIREAVSSDEIIQLINNLHKDGEPKWTM